MYLIYVIEIQWYDIVPLKWTKQKSNMNGSESSIQGVKQAVIQSNPQGAYYTLLKESWVLENARYSFSLDHVAVSLMEQEQKAYDRLERQMRFISFMLCEPIILCYLVLQRRLQRVTNIFFTIYLWSS